MVPAWEGLVRSFDSQLAEPEIEGIPIGSTLTDLLVIEIINGGGKWGLAQRGLDRLRWLRQYYRATRRSEAATPLGGPQPGRPGTAAPVKQGRFLVTWRSSTARFDELILPLLEAFSPDCCAVLYQNPNVLARLPSGADAICWAQAVPHDRGRWLSAFRRCWPQWRSRLQSLCKSFGLPQGAMERLSLAILVNSQLAVGCLDLLERYQPAAVVTDYDRAGLASSLVLAARSVGIATFSLQHGVLGQDAEGYVPVIADRMFCWGELHRRLMTEAGQDPDRLEIGGCSRLTRELCAEPGVIRGRLKIDPAHRVAMLGTSPVPPAQRRLLAAWFCEAVKQIDGVSGIVRLHPSENLEFYADVAGKHPHVTFMDNSRMSLDESFAASDLVVVQGSGLGSDALVKRRLVVVVEIPGAPLEHGKDLIEHAGCPQVGSAQDLAAALRRLLFDEDARRCHFAAAERYVENFCACFGAESARRIADAVRLAVDGRGDGSPQIAGRKAS
jgi:hypothetical protein